MNFYSRTAALFLMVGVFISSARAEEPVLASSALKDFVSQKDDAFQFEVMQRGDIANCKWLRLHMVSQHWKDTDWKHVVWIIAPNSWIDSKNAGTSDSPIQDDSALLLISGGSWKDQWGDKSPDNMEPNGEMKIMAKVAETTNCPTVVVSQIPFQPMLGNRHEDALISETFRRYLAGEGDDWPLLMPMVRAAIRTMDATQSVVESEWKHPIRRFTVTGASKRGWTTWLTSAVDSRVDAMAPMVIDMLNMPIQMKHQVATWGKYSEEIEDYTRLDLPKYLSTPGGVSLQRIVDPFRYRKSLVQPKLLIFGTNDRYWPLDACNLYWQDLDSPKYLLYVPNQPHGIADYPRLVGGLCALHRSRTGQGELPKLNWSVAPKDGKMVLTMKSDVAAVKAELWQAFSQTRDFRDSKWTATDMQCDDALEHSGACETPKEGYAAFFGDWTFEIEGGMPVHFTTNVRIVANDQK